MVLSEISEEKDEEAAESQRERIRKMIEHQKSLYWSSCSSSSLSSSCLSSRTSDSLLDLMKGGSTSLRRLFDMEHTSLSKHFVDYSGSPVVKPILLWGSDTDDEIHVSWPPVNPSSVHQEFSFKTRTPAVTNTKLTRKKSFRRLPRFSLWKCGKFSFRFRLRRIKARIRICGRKL